jgi:hypothetical protein
MFVPDAVRVRIAASAWVMASLSSWPLLAKKKPSGSPSPSSSNWF